MNQFNALSNSVQYCAVGRYSIVMALYYLATHPALIDQLNSGEYWDNGKTIREGDKVLLWFVSDSRDESVFEKPHEVMLGRSPNRHLAFGQGGAHMCLGMHMAKLEVGIVLQELLKRVSNFICGVKQLQVEVGA